MRTALLCDITQHSVVSSYGRFGTTMGTVFKGQEFLEFLTLDRPAGCLKTSVRIATPCGLISHNSAEIIYIAAEAWNRVIEVIIFSSSLIAVCLT